jgi:hypothetical protein
MAGSIDLGKLFGKNSPAEQLLIWQVLAQFVSAVMGPEFEMLSRGVNEILQATPLTPDQLADMVVKGHILLGDGEAYAKQSGIAPSDFKRMVDTGGEPPGIDFLLQAFRRGYIAQSGTGPDSTSLEQGIRESRLKDKWVPVIESMNLQPIGISETVDAVVEGQIAYDIGAHYAYVNGVDPDSFRILVNTRGNPPSPGELAVLLKRKLIPLEGTGPDAISFQQGIFEGASKDKWWTYYAKLADYIPPPRTITTLVHDGSLSDADALVAFEEAGLTPQWAKIFLASAHHSAASAHKATISTELRTQARKAYTDGHIPVSQYRTLLTQAQVPAAAIELDVQAANLAREFNHHSLSLAQIKSQRQNGLIDDAQARQLLVSSGWTEDVANGQIAEWAVEAKRTRTGFSESRILAYLKSGILTESEAYDLLVGMGINSANATFLVKNPQAVAAVKSHGSTAADIVAAYKDGVLTQDQAKVKLVDGGETAEAADLKLQIASFVLNRGPKPRHANKSLTEAQVLEAFKLGLAADTWALRELTTLGFSDLDAALLVAIEEAKLAKAVPPGWTVLT